MSSVASSASGSGSLIVSGRLTSHKIPRDRYRFLRSTDFGLFIQFIQTIKGQISYELYDGFDEIPLFVKTFVPGLQNQVPVDFLCYESFLKITIKLNNGRTQILQYQGYFADNLIKLIELCDCPLRQPPTISSKTTDRTILENTKSYVMVHESQLSLTYWPN